MELGSEYWNNRYKEHNTGWDIGYIATPLKGYFDQLHDKSIRILIPGAGNAYEVEYLYQNKFKNIFLLDFSPISVENFLQRLPHFPKKHIFTENFFEHGGQYDLIVELAFFSSINPELRGNYVNKMNELLKPGGKLVGLLFNVAFGNKFPPFGGTKEEYQKLFEASFYINMLEAAYNSIKPRKGREIFINLTKK